jgi:hypothetical protein
VVGDGADAIRVSHRRPAELLDEQRHARRLLVTSYWGE